MAGMSDPKTKRSSWTGPVLTPRRVFLAVAIAVLADLLQIVLVPIAWTFVQAIVDVVAMLLVLPVLGFHLLLLPTFVIEFMPGVDMLPTWTGCVIAVIALKKRAQERETAPEQPPVIEVSEIKPPRTLEQPSTERSADA